MGGTPTTLRDSLVYIGGAIVLCQDVQVRVWVDKDALLGAHHRCIWGQGARGDDSDHSGLARAPRCDNVERIFGHLYLLSEVREGLLRVGNTPY